MKLRCVQTQNTSVIIIYCVAEVLKKPNKIMGSNLSVRLENVVGVFDDDGY